MRKFKMLYTANYWWIIAILVIALVPISGHSLLIDGCEFGKPFFGRTECKVINPSSSESYTRFTEPQHWVKRSGGIIQWNAYTIFDRCGNDENTRACTYSFRTIPKVGSTTDVGMNRLLFRRCSSADESSCDTWIEKLKFLQSNEKVQLSGIEDFKSDNNQWIQVWVDVNAFTDPNQVYPELISDFKAYGLVAYDAGRRDFLSTVTCNIWDLPSQKNAACGNTLTSSVAEITGTIDPSGNTQVGVSASCQATLGKTALGNDIRSTGRLPFDDNYNYVTAFVPVIATNNIIKLSTGENVFLTTGAGGVNAYKIEKLTREDKTCYSVPTSLKQNNDQFTCIPGQIQANSICIFENDKTFYKVQTLGECANDKECIDKLGSGYICYKSGTSDAKCQLTGQTCFSDLQCAGGSFYTDTSNPAIKQISRQACINNVCKVVETKQVECTPPANGCSTGVCDITTYKCVSQKGPSPVFFTEVVNFGATLQNFLGALIIAALIVGAVAFFLFKPLLNPKFFILAALGLALLLFFGFGGIQNEVRTVTAMIFGG